MKKLALMVLISTGPAAPAMAQAFLQGQGDQADPVVQWMEHVTEVGDKVCLEIKDGFFLIQPPYFAVPSGGIYIQLSPTFVDCKDGSVDSIHSG